MTALHNDFEFKVLAQSHLGLPNTVHMPAGVRAIALWLNETPHDLVYLNSFFDREYSLPILTLRRAGRLARRPMLVAPRGELLKNALSIKSGRKRAYIQIVRALGLCSDAWLHATSYEEMKQSRLAFPWWRGLLVAPEVTPQVVPVPAVGMESGVARLVFMGRIAPIKNLDFALRALTLTRAKVRLDIYGPLNESRYWALCQQLIRDLPRNVSVVHHHEIPHDQMPEVYARSDLLFLPSKSENFGHAIFEALSCSVPVLIGNATPWRDLQLAEAGWDLPLDDPALFANVIDEFARLPEPGRERLRQGARRLAERYVERSDAVERNRRMLNLVLGRGLSEGGT
jgi:glycosyltransferase involved in cell wall biosynthesis